MREIIDIHAHILPGVDDGCANMEETLALVQKSMEQGMVEIIATPHYGIQKRANAGLQPHAARNCSPEELKEITEAVQKAITTEVQINFHPGQELHYHEELAEELNEGACLTLAGSRYVLIEWSTDAEYEYMYRGLRKIIEAGYTPILAHMERYMRLDGPLAGPGGRNRASAGRGYDRAGRNHDLTSKSHANIRELKKMGCRMQMNYDSLYSTRKTALGRHLDQEVKRCRELIEEGLIDVLATDMHRPDFRPPAIAPALKWLEDNIEEDEIERLTYVNPKHILEDENLE